MNHLATALLRTAAFLELSPDEVIDPDSAIAAMEEIAHILQSCSDAERAALQEAISSEVSKFKKAGAPPATIEFYEEFFDNFGLNDDE